MPRRSGAPDARANDSAQLRGYLDLLFIAAQLEWIGDQATNIGEEIVYLAAAEDIRPKPWLTQQ
jgi:phosphate uptake regulator